MEYGGKAKSCHMLVVEQSPSVRPILNVQLFIPSYPLHWELPTDCSSEQCWSRFLGRRKGSCLSAFKHRLLVSDSDIGDV